MVTRTELLETAGSHITRDRAATHGKAENSFQTIAEYWTTYLNREFHSKELELQILISAKDVAVMMALFKVARLHNNPAHVDNWIDLIGYAALGGEIANPGPNPNPDLEPDGR